MLQDLDRPQTTVRRTFIQMAKIVLNLFFRTFLFSVFRKENIQNIYSNLEESATLYRAVSRLKEKSQLSDKNLSSLIAYPESVSFVLNDSNYHVLSTAELEDILDGSEKTDLPVAKLTAGSKSMTSLASKQPLVYRSTYSRSNAPWIDKISDNVIEGVVVSFLDMSELIKCLRLNKRFNRFGNKQESSRYLLFRANSYSKLVRNNLMEESKEEINSTMWVLFKEVLNHTRETYSLAQVKPSNLFERFFVTTIMKLSTQSLENNFMYLSKRAYSKYDDYNVLKITYKCDYEKEEEECVKDAEIFIKQVNDFFPKANCRAELPRRNLITIYMNFKSFIKDILPVMGVFNELPSLQQHTNVKVDKKTYKC